MPPSDQPTRKDCDRTALFRSTIANIKVSAAERLPAEGNLGACTWGWYLGWSEIVFCRGPLLSLRIDEFWTISHARSNAVTIRHATVAMIPNAVQKMKGSSISHAMWCGVRCLMIIAFSNREVAMVPFSDSWYRVSIQPQSRFLSLISTGSEHDALVYRYHQATKPKMVTEQEYWFGVRTKKSGIVVFVEQGVCL